MNRTTKPNYEFDQQFQSELVLDSQSILGEGPCWDPTENVLWWIDVRGQLVHRYSPATAENASYRVGQSVGCVVRRHKGGLMVAVENGFASFDPASESCEILADPEFDRPGNRFNDGKCDPSGRFWAGTMDDAEVDPRAGSLYCLDLDGQVHKRLEKIGVSNGIVWSADRQTMYFIDSPTRRVDAFDYDDTSGEISQRRTVVEVPEGWGWPDGMAIDAQDRLWVALWAGWGVACFDPANGQPIAFVDVPVARSSACCFGGPALDLLYITTARDKMTADEPDQPLAGGLFYADVGTRGTVFGSYLG